MIKLVANDLGKKYVHHWVFRHLNDEWTAGQRIAITGANGSGKSTLLQVLSGAAPATEGALHHELEGKNLDVNYWYQHLAMATPAFDLPEALTLQQFLDFHLRLKPLRQHHSALQVAEELALKAHLQKEIRLFSSGMKQRLKLALALWADVPLVLLDEPTSHLDAHYTCWYQEQLKALPSSALVFVASNDPREYPDFNRAVAIGVKS